MKSLLACTPPSKLPKGRKRQPPLVRLAVYLWSLLKGKQVRQKPPELWPLDQPLLRWGEGEDAVHTIRAATTGVFVCGATGSGKTNFVGYHLAKSYLQAGFGIAVIATKSDDVDWWLKLAEETGRTGDVLLFDHPDKSPLRFNWLRYECERPGWGAGVTESLVKIFSEVSEITSRRPGQQHGHSDAF